MQGLFFARKGYMRLIDGLKLKGYPAEIPDCSRNDLPQLMKDLGFTKGVEIGVYKAEFTKLFAQAGLEIYGIDPWMVYDDFDLMHENRKNRQQFLYEHCHRVLDQYPKAHMVRKTSVEALKDFPDGSLDFVYIDGNHKFVYVAEDIYWWSKKVKKGGIISGHDYIHPSRFSADRMLNLQVKFVVDAYLEAFQIKNWYLIGRREAPKGEKRDRFLSWMWINE